jgi:hypothetical protein
MNNEQIKNAVTSPWPFFGVTAQGDVLARYVPYGPVFRWRWNQMIPMPVQGSDLVWLLHAAEEEGHGLSSREKDKSQADKAAPGKARSK